jgi:hypothetical protein
MKLCTIVVLGKMAHFVAIRIWNFLNFLKTRKLVYFVQIVFEIYFMFVLFYSEDGFLGVSLSIGLVGLALLAIVIATTWYCVRRRQRAVLRDNAEELTVYRFNSSVLWKGRNFGEDTLKKEKNLEKDWTQELEIVIY